MKKLVFMFLISLPLFAAMTVSDMPKAVTIASEELAGAIDLKQVDGYQIKLEEDEVTVDFLHANFAEGLTQFGCHYHGPEVVCHLEDEDHDHEKDLLDEGSGQISFSDLRAAEAQTIERFRTIVGAQASTIRQLQAWRYKGEAWLEVKFQYNGLKTAILQCHRHEAGGSLFCHRRLRSVNKPKFP